jgi:hypothetical protein
MKRKHGHAPTVLPQSGIATSTQHSTLHTQHYTLKTQAWVARVALREKKYYYKIQDTEKKIFYILRR